MSSKHVCSSLDDAQRKLLSTIAGICDHGGNLSEEAGEEVLRITAADINTYQYLCEKGFVRAKDMVIGFGAPYGLSPEGLECAASIQGESS